MITFKKRLNKRPLTLILIIVMVVVSVMFRTASAWVIVSNINRLGKNAAQIQTASINASYKVNYGKDKCFYPKGSFPAIITITNDGSSRAYVYEIDLTKCKIISDSDEFELGGIEFAKASPKIINHKYYGVMNPDEISQNVKVNFIFDEVSQYTKGAEIDFKNLNIRYCQATPAAMEDVFGLDEIQIDALIALVD